MYTLPIDKEFLSKKAASRVGLEKSTYDKLKYILSRLLQPV